MDHDPDSEWMLAALELAAKGPVADPNPRVGCVLVQGNSLVGEGWHAGAGSLHAEAVAVRDAGPAAMGATAYVTLEPCTHQGRTPPCAEALIAAGVARVVVAARDESTLAGGGVDRLRAAGVQVRTGVRAAQAAALNEAWAFAVAHGRPAVTWKVAATLDGRVAASDGSSRWITAAAAREQVHQLRAEVGAVIVGTGTVLADDPRLTVRLPGHDPNRQPVRVVVGCREIPRTAQVHDAAAPTMLCRTHDPAQVLAALHRREVRHALLEGGPTLAAAFVRAGLVDRIVAYVAPALLGSGPSLIADLGVESIDAARRWQLADVRQVGADARLELVPQSATATETDGRQ